MDRSGRQEPMTEIRGIARLKIHDSKFEEFKRLAAKCMESVRSKDSGTLQYDWFFRDDSSECIVFERYRDSDALLEHVANLGDTMNAFFQICSISGEILGTPSAALRKALEGVDVRVYSPYQSL
jgi:quinol monooxygenase YgiN